MNAPTNTNPLLDFAGLPHFDTIAPTHVAPAIDALLKAANEALETVTQDDFPADWTSMATVLDVVTERLSHAWGAVSHLNGVADTPELRAAYNEALPRVTEFYTRLGADERLFAKYKAMDVAKLTDEQRQAHKNAMRGFVLGGADLKGEARKRFAWLQERQAELTQKFSENALDATDGFAIYVSAEELAGVPGDVLKATAAAAKVDGKSGHKLTLKLPVYLPVMQFAHNAGVREQLYKAYATRASDQAPKESQIWDNTAIMVELLALRQEESELLGYRHFADVSLVPKMAESPEQVVAFLRELAVKAKPFGEKDLADLKSIAASDLGLNDPQPWDWTYISEKLKEARYAFSEQEVKPYFPLDKVLAGLFQIVETLFDVAIRPDQAAVWNPSVRFFRIERNSPKGMQLVGQFYLDPSARNGKRGGAWMDDVRARWMRPDTGLLQTPVAHLVCNFSEGVDGKPALLTHDDVITLFHEFGHGLHHMLTQVNEHDVSGISGVEWDAVELPSQFMENFCWEWDVLKHMTAHVDTGAPLPRELFDKMLAAKNFQSGWQTLRQVEMSLVDMLLHSQATPPASGEAMLALHQQVRDEVALLVPPAYSRTINTFSHIFAGGYSAGYYSYKWAEVLSADAYAAFEEAGKISGQGALDVATGRRYRETILEAGGSRPAMESFKAFRGREPTIDALLRHQGMA
ncbi:oligopeptidase A [Hydrogenophaga crassostreae]|uniref:oligopeptidase A n=1 Tax=Hydrogenophaga crassostreae TaxID=1763535 RepID=A0A167HUP6_9BURK|nr:M3 family metallopeptidase [Hydrogenophaga crassostreae]AOW13468.1 oligopeptidase A [Hydrogenophaga crassostreae]OAD41759.1 oligopeptidase A [Hydrogenophaga crassostreae]